jgi:hypothetical protein
MVNPFSFAHLDTVFVAFCSRASVVFGVYLLVKITQSLVGSLFPLHISAIATRKRVTLSSSLMSYSNVTNKKSRKIGDSK